MRLGKQLHRLLATIAPLLAPCIGTPQVVQSPLSSRSREAGRLDWPIAFLDGSFAPAKRCGELVGVTKKGKGTKWTVVVDGNDLLLGFHLDSANSAEVRLAEQTLDTIAVARPRNCPKQRPEKLLTGRE
jgi:hypothetical protein